MNQSVLDDPAQCSLGSFDTALASIGLAPFALSVEAHAPAAQGIHGAAATATVTYSFQVVGGNPGDVVPILIAAQLDSFGSDPSLGIGFASLLVSTSAAGGTAAQVAVCSDGTCGTTATSFSGVLSARVRSGDTGNQLTVTIQASVVGNGAAAELASASADPYLFVDPSFATASLYSIVVSPGVANVAMPEPGAALLAGGALVASAIRRRRPSSSRA